MKWLKITPQVLALAVLALSPQRASAQTVQTFEPPFICTGTDNSVGLYGPVDYLNLWGCFGTTQSPFTAHSLPNRIYTRLGTGPFDFISGPVTFNGAWFAGAASVRFDLTLGGIPVWSSTTLSTSDVSTWLGSGYSGLVDGVQVVTDRPGGWYVMDDVTFNSSVVPEPATMTLLGTGLVGLYGAARRRRNRAT